MSYPPDPDQYEDLANPRPRRGLLQLVAIIIGLLMTGVGLLVFFLVRG